eukprot:gene11086-18697_t
MLTQLGIRINNPQQRKATLHRMVKVLIPEVTHSDETQANDISPLTANDISPFTPDAQVALQPTETIGVVPPRPQSHTNKDILKEEIYDDWVLREPGHECVAFGKVALQQKDQEFALTTTLPHRIFSNTRMEGLGGAEVSSGTTQIHSVSCRLRWAKRSGGR